MDDAAFMDALEASQDEDAELDDGFDGEFLAAFHVICEVFAEELNDDDIVLVLFSVPV